MVISSFKVVCPKRMVCNAWMKAIFQHKIQRIFRILIEEKCSSQVTKTDKLINYVAAIKNEHSA